MMQAMVAPYGKTFTWEIKTKQMGRKLNEAAEILISKIICFIYKHAKVELN